MYFPVPWCGSLLAAFPCVWWGPGVFLGNRGGLVTAGSLPWSRRPSTVRGTRRFAVRLPAGLSAVSAPVGFHPLPDDWGKDAGDQRSLADSLRHRPQLDVLTQAFGQTQIDGLGRFLASLLRAGLLFCLPCRLLCWRSCWRRCGGGRGADLGCRLRQSPGVGYRVLRAGAGHLVGSEGD